MSGVELHKTVMGRHLFEATLPQSVMELRRLGGQLVELNRLLVQLVELRVGRRRVLLVHHHVPTLQALDRSLRSQHDVCLARTYNAARELIELYEFDTCVVDEATAEERPGLSLFEQARAVRPEALCIVLGPGADRDLDRERRAVDVALDDEDVSALLDEIPDYIR